MTKQYPPVPQTGRQPEMLSQEQEMRLLSRRISTDNTDWFASDPNEDVRRLGRLALRRKQPDPNDAFALGDKCAKLSFNQNHLMVMYVGKTLLAYNRAGQQSHVPADIKLSENIRLDYIRWVMDIARETRTPRNLAIGLWAASEISSKDQPEDIHDDAMLLAELYLKVVARAGHSPRENAELIPNLSDQLTTDELNVEGKRQKPPSKLLETRPDLFETQGEFEEGTLNDYASPEVEKQTHSDEVDKDRTPPDILPTSDHDLVSEDQGVEENSSHSGDFRVGDVLAERYEVRRVVRGGMGIIYLCFDQKEPATVAIKTYQGKFLENQRALSRFIQEAHTWIRLGKHPNIVQARVVKDIGNERIRPRPHILLEYIVGPEGLGPDLKSWIEQRRLDLEKSLRFALNICQGMQYATQTMPGLVHRDLKPANILVRHDSIAKVTDFGLAQAFEHDPAEGSVIAPSVSGEPGSPTGAVVGTAPYMSPEQCRGESVDQRTDIYAFGAILYEMLTGHQLFRAHTFAEWIQAHLSQEPKFPRKSASNIKSVPAELKAFVIRCLSKNRDERPTSWADVAQELSALYNEIVGEPFTAEFDTPAMHLRELLDQAYSLTELDYAHEALAIHDKALEIAPNSANAWTSKSRTLRQLNQLEEAMVCCEKALELDQSFAWAWRTRGLLLEKLGSLHEALTSYQTAAELRPGDVWPVYNQAGVLRELGRYDDALEAVDRTLEIDPSLAQGYIRRGQILRALQRYDDALQSFTDALDHDPYNGNAWDGKGLVYKITGKLTEATSAFMQATRLLPDAAWPWEHLAEALIDQSRYNEALPVLQQALRLAVSDGQKALLLSKQGHALRYLRRYDDALEIYDTALHLVPDMARALAGKGMVMERLGKLEEALTYFERATVADPGDVWNYYNLGNLLAAMGRYPEAILKFKCAIKQDRKHAGAWAAWGNALRRLGKFKKALIYYDQALKIESTYAWAWNERGVALESLSRYEEAIKAYRQASAAAPNEPLYRYNEADTLIALQRYEEALTALTNVTEIDPQYVRAWARRGQVLRRLNRLEEAIESYRKATELDPRYAWAWNGQGLALSEFGRHQEALECFKQATTHDGQDAWYWYNLADEYLALDDAGEAIEALDEALKIDEEHSESWAKRGQALRRLGRYKESVAAYDRALAINPKFAWAWNGRGRALEQMNRREEAILSYERAAQEDPSNVWHWLNQLDPLLAMNRRDDALEVCDQAIDAVPMSAVAWARKGQVLRRFGDSQHQLQAISAYERALDLDPHYAWAWNGKGLAHAALAQNGVGRWEDALVCYEKAIQEDESDVWFWHNRGEALLELGRYEEAIIILNQALEVDPHHEPSRRKRTEARQKYKANGDE